MTVGRNAQILKNPLTNIQ